MAQKKRTPKPAPTVEIVRSSYQPNASDHKSTRGPGRPEKQDIKLLASAEEIARNVFTNAEPVDPSKRGKTTDSRKEK